MHQIKFTITLYSCLERSNIKLTFRYCYTIIYIASNEQYFYCLVCPPFSRGAMLTIN